MKHHYTWMFFLFFLFSGCVTTPDQPPTTLELLTNTETLLTAVQDELIDATERGVVDIASAEYARVYHSLRRAGEILDMAWAAWRAGNTESAHTQAQVASSIYWEIRPLIQEVIDDGNGSRSEGAGSGIFGHQYVEPVRVGQG